MGEYLVLARKYRSASFDDVVGQVPIAQTLKNAIATGRVAHAYLFTGTRGVGKTTMARILAKALNCLKSPESTVAPCGKCDSCVCISRGDDVDVVEIDGASNRGIDEIRQLRANAIFRPSRSRYKIYYIDEVHMLTREAFNALLKTLEEPPAHVKFIFATTDVEKVPATIISRCQRFDFRNIPTRQIAAHLKTICASEKVLENVQENALFRIARAGAGSMRDALSLLDQLLASGASGEKVSEQEVVRILGTPADERTISIIEAIACGDGAAALGELSAVLDGGVSLTSATLAIGECYRNMMIIQVCGRDSDLVELPDSQRDALAGLAGKFSLPALVQAVGICQSTARSVRASSVGKALVEAMLVRLAKSEHFVDPASLLQRLEELEAGATEKKKHSQHPTGAGVDDSFSASDDYKPAGVAITWDESWIKANWHRVIEALTLQRNQRLAGALRPANVLGFDGAVLKLAFDAAHDGLLQQCRNSLAVHIEEALTRLAGRAIRCEWVADESSPSIAREQPSPAPASAVLSTAEKTQIVNDPAVKAVLDLFGGEVADIRRLSPPAEK